MKKIITLIVALLPLTAFAQFSRDNIGIEQRGDQYIVRDTFISGNDTLIQTRITKGERFAADYFAEVDGVIRDVATSKANAIAANQRAERQKAELQKLGLLSAYLQYVDNKINVSGSFQVSYAGTNTVLTAGPDENLYTQANNKVVNVLEINEEWLRLTLLSFGNEVVDVFRVNADTWAGEGDQGLLIIKL